ncbi:hypothetical protein [Burkholderia sp. Tr-20390]|uniref:hypothetical protein n=1 Tax=Burkholderia sp. Tr-20390 TaxID=2703904 RepID=UPI00197CBB00|nr:hypothetical protein [Burkholderia sp. Tr-20390]MBN3730235.1 hypothetical protein [Burkholderia sp. Tr-20390]
MSIVALYLDRSPEVIFLRESSAPSLRCRLIRALSLHALSECIMWRQRSSGSIASIGINVTRPIRESSLRSRSQASPSIDEATLP